MAEFLNKSEQQEVILLQRMQDIEAKEIYNATPVNQNVVKPKVDSEVLKLPVHQSEIPENVPDEIKPYEEFW